MADQNQVHQAAAEAAARDAAADIAKATAQGAKILNDQQARHNQSGTGQKGSFTQPGGRK
jgi:hypothetical protein